MHRAHSFAITFRFIDDLSEINDNGLPEKHFKEIYPEELDLKKEKVSCTKASFLDIEIQIFGIISTNLYNKRYSSPCEITCLPFFDSNIPSKIFYSSNGFEILHLARNTSDHVTFIVLVNKLLGRISKQRSQKKVTKILLNKIFGSHFEAFSKIAATAKGFNILFKL